MSVARDRALLLARTPFGESSLVVQLVTNEHGRVHLMAKGAYRRTAAFAWILDWFDTLELEWNVPRGTGELGTLRAGSIAVRRHAPRRSLACYRAAFEVLELSGLAAREEQSDRELFVAAEAGLDDIELSDGEPTLALAGFQLRLLSALGLSPALERCASCGRDARPFAGEGAPRVAFSAGAGGRLCLPCAREARAAGRRVGTLPAALIDDVATFSRELGNPRSRATLPGERAAEVARFVERFMDHHLESRPRSRSEFVARR